MELREGEKILKVYHHHPTPFVWQIIKVLVAFFPFFFLAFLFQGAFSAEVFFTILLGIFALFVLVIIYVSLIYWLDKIVVTNMRVVHIDWKYLTLRDEAEALLDDIQDIQTREKGFLSNFRAFDYGKFKLDTSSSYVTLVFTQAPDPEGMRQFIFHIKGNR